MIEVIAEERLTLQINHEYLADCLWTIEKHGRDKGDLIYIQKLINSGITTKIISFLVSEEMPIVIPSLLILKIISEGSPAQRKIFMNEADFFKQIDEKMHHRKRSIRKIIMEIITNLSAGPDFHLQKLLTKDRVEKILQCL